MTFPLPGAHRVFDGPSCRACRQPETRCAEAVLRGGCCTACSHWDRYDKDGNPKIIAPAVGYANPLGKVCGTDVGFERHMGLRERPCQDCRLAHFRAKGWVL